ncbi:Rieske 2Fe-2S domain-containing protein [Streptomyces sp. NPDC057654]|uniref:Rieske 2Fe-2S domain-containing protein n=1 Tax=Streptomyces sp. NPDC057654 TaxID=3346196 RepID=UPI00367C3BE9
MTKAENAVRAWARRSGWLYPVRTARDVPASAGVPGLPYPNGWYCLGFSVELPRGRVITRRLAGEDVVLYRTQSGLARAVDPYCPHLGAHLGAGGTIDGENLVCPFHGFAFAPDGACVGSPDNAVLRARLTTRPVFEHNGILVMWHGHDGNRPAWELPNAVDPAVTPTARWSMELPTHPQEIVENVCDYRHLGALHRLPVRLISPPTADGPLLRTNLRSEAARIPFLGSLTWENSTLMAGLGWTLTELSLPRFGLVVHVWGMATPLEPAHSRFRLAVACTVTDPRRVPGPNVPGYVATLTRGVAQAVLRMTARILRDDVMIWKHKRYEPIPKLAANERSIGVFRHWTRQFYPPAPASAPDGGAASRT